MIVCDETHVKQVQKQLGDCVRLLDHYEWLINSFVLDFFLDAHWGHLPASWQPTLTSITPDQLAAWLDPEVAVELMLWIMFSTIMNLPILPKNWRYPLSRPPQPTPLHGLYPCSPWSKPSGLVACQENQSMISTKSKVFFLVRKTFPKPSPEGSRLTFLEKTKSSIQAGKTFAMTQNKPKRAGYLSQSFWVLPLAVTQVSTSGKFTHKI